MIVFRVQNDANLGPWHWSKGHIEDLHHLVDEKHRINHNVNLDDYFVPTIYDENYVCGCKSLKDLLFWFNEHYLALFAKFNKRARVVAYQVDEKTVKYYKGKQVSFNLATAKLVASVMPNNYNKLKKYEE